MTFNRVILTATLFLTISTNLVFSINRGLVNQGNSCYMNAATQCLAHVQPFVEYLKANEAQFQANEQIKQFIILLKNIRDNTNQQDPTKIKPFDPKSFYNKSFVGRKFSQQDSSEFFIPLLDKINESDKSPSIVQQTFGFRQISRLTCPLCNHISDTVEEILDLETFQVKSLKNSLELPLWGEGKLQLHNLLTAYFTQEILDDANRWQCSSCNKYVNATKKLLLGNPPEFMIITLKRFPGPGQKDGRPVSFPLHNLNLKEFTADQKDTFYELIGIDIHHGGAGGGHYFAYCKDFDNNQWYQFNDSSVSFAHDVINNIANQTADPGGPYILFYKRQAIPPIEPEPEKPDPKPEPIPKPTPPAFAELIIDEGLKENLIKLEVPTQEKTVLLESLRTSNESYYFAKTKDGESPLHLFIDYLKKLFESESAIKDGFLGEEVKQELTPKSYFDYFKFLVNNFDINAQLPESQETIMHMLIKDKTLEYYINSNMQGNDEYKFLSFLKILLKQKPNYNLVDKDGSTPFYSIIRYLSPEDENLIYYIMSNYDVFIDVPSYNKQNVLHLLMQQIKPSNPDMPDNQSIANNILNYLIGSATTKNFSNAIKDPLTGLCQLIRTQDDYGKTPLHYALEKNNIEGATILLTLLFKHSQGNNAVLNLTSNPYGEDLGKSIQELAITRGLNNLIQQLKKDYPDQREPVTEQTISKIMIIVLQELSKNEKTKNAITNSIAQFATFKNEILSEIEDKDPQPTLDELYELIKNKILKVILQSPLEQQLSSLKTNLQALKGRLSTLKESVNTLKTKLSGHKKCKRPIDD